MMPPETILAVHEQGADAVVELVERLCAQLADQQEVIASLTARVDQLEETGWPTTAATPPSRPQAIW